MMRNTAILLLVLGGTLSGGCSTSNDSGSDNGTRHSMGGTGTATGSGAAPSNSTGGSPVDAGNATDTSTATNTETNTGTGGYSGADSSTGSTTQTNTGTNTDTPVVDGFDVENPLIRNRADPWILRHSDGYYYFVATVPEYDRIVLRRAQTIPELATASEHDIWTKHATGAMGAHIWAPELHFIDGAWYIYFAAGRTDDVWAIRMYVLENTVADPLSNTWTERGQIQTDIESFSLDATTFEQGGVRYLVWAQSDPQMAAHNTNIYIAPLSNPWTLGGAKVLISQSEYDWEKVTYPVNEGPAVLQKNGRVFISYSASATDANYAVGLLWADETSDLLDATSWHKSPQPVLQSGNGIYGPGHSCFTTSPQGTHDVLVYHGRDYEDIEGDPLYDPNRHTRVQELGWDNDGMPILGPPAPNGTAHIGDP